MCILKIYNDSKSFRPFSQETEIPVYSVLDKGEYRNKKKTRKMENYSISLDVSDREWDDFDGQVSDAVQFLKVHRVTLKKLLNTAGTTDAYLDFPIYSRLNKEIANQNDHLPRELISLAGELNLGIEMAQYAKNAFK